MTHRTQSFGREGERIAVDYLTEKGYRILRRNYRFGRGEIDIIAQDGTELVFVEVKTRRTSAFGEPEEAVTPKKQSQIRTVAAAGSNTRSTIRNAASTSLLCRSGRMNPQFTISKMHFNSPSVRGSFS